MLPYQIYDETFAKSGLESDLPRFSYDYRSAWLLIS